MTVGVSKILASLKKAPLLREHRIYQADFLMRFYGFNADELLSEKNPNLDLKLDPKLFYAIENYNGPIEINRATYEELLRIPGFGPKSCRKIINARRYAALKYDDLKTLGISLKRSSPFITVGGKYEGFKFDTIEALRHSFDEPSPVSYTHLDVYKRQDRKVRVQWKYLVFHGNRNRSQEKIIFYKMEGDLHFLFFENIIGKSKSAN